MNGTPGRARDREASDQAIGLETSHRQERFHAHSLRAGGCRELELGVEADQRGRKIGSGEFAGAKVPADGRDLTHGGVGRLGGGPRERRALGHRRESLCEICMRDASADYDFPIENVHMAQLVYPRNRDIGARRFFTADGRAHDPGRAGDRRRQGPAIVQCREGVGQRARDV